MDTDRFPGVSPETRKVASLLSESRANQASEYVRQIQELRNLVQRGVRDEARQIWDRLDAELTQDSKEVSDLRRTFLLSGAAVGAGFGATFWGVGAIPGALVGMALNRFVGCSLVESAKDGKWSDMLDRLRIELGPRPS